MASTMNESIVTAIITDLSDKVTCPEDQLRDIITKHTAGFVLASAVKNGGKGHHNGYHLYIHEQRQKLGPEGWKESNFFEKGKDSKLREQWHTLSEEEKKVWSDKAKASNAVAKSSGAVKASRKGQKTCWSVFSHEYKQQLKEGETYSSADASVAWKALSKEEQEKYRVLAKKANEEAPVAEQDATTSPPKQRKVNVFTQFNGIFNKYAAKEGIEIPKNVGDRMKVCSTFYKQLKAENELEKILAEY